MAKSLLVVYEPLAKFTDKQNYWSSYISFYQQYWDSPASPNSAWFGKEYEDFREALSRELEVDKEHIEDCFFTKDEKGSYFLAPIGFGSNTHVLTSDSAIPPEWFLLFIELEKKFIYAHSGFGAISRDGIYYQSSLAVALNRLKEANSTLSTCLTNHKTNERNFRFFHRLNELNSGVQKLRVWLGKFDPSGTVLLNYGELSNFIEPSSNEKEESVKDMRELLSLISENRLEEAASLMLITLDKWDNIRRQFSGKSGDFFLQ